MERGRGRETRIATSRLVAGPKYTRPLVTVLRVLTDDYNSFFTDGVAAVGDTAGGK